MACVLLCVKVMAVAVVFPQEEVSQHPARLGGYHVLDHIAAGGMATVFRGQNTRTGEIVALKTVLTAQPYEISSLDREIDTLRNLNHPGIVRFVDHGKWLGLPWMAVELLEGRTLFDEVVSMWSDISDERPSHRPGHIDWCDRLQADPALATPVRTAAAGRLRYALTLVVRLAPMLDYLHRRGVVHRDVKPPNVFLGDDGRMTLLDFGLACRTRNVSGAFDTDEKQCCMGTMEYSSPEQICGEPVDGRTDVYSLGCILYELVTGRIPFEGPSPGEIAQKHLDRDPVCPSDLVSGLPWLLEDLILAALAKEPARRPRSAGEIADQLTRLLRNPSPKH
jgi:serine/threonine protein kinase